MSAFFITATGTDIGKTYVTAGLLRHARARGTEASAIKPVMSGFDPVNASESDAGTLLAAMGEPVSPANIERIAPWRFAEPLSPDMAAARECRSIDFGALVSFCRERLAAARGTFFIEGVGGVMVPLDGAHTVLDWMKALGLPAIVIGGSYLGTISHTLTALDVLKCAGIAVAALALNESPQSPVPLAETAETIRRFSPRTNIAAIARNADDGDFATLFALLER